MKEETVRGGEPACNLGLKIEHTRVTKKRMKYVWWWRRRRKSRF